MTKIANDAIDAIAQMNRYVLCFNGSSDHCSELPEIPPSVGVEFSSEVVASSPSSISIEHRGGNRDVNMTGQSLHRKGNRRTSPVSGNRTIVALSSISLVDGNSPKTVKGARRRATRSSVPIQKWQPTQMM